MNELIFLVEEAPEGGFTARALDQAIFTEADDLPSLREQIRDAVRCHFEELNEMVKALPFYTLPSKTPAAKTK